MLTNIKVIQAQLFVQNLEYQYFQQKWHLCQVDQVILHNNGDNLDLQIFGSDKYGPYELFGKIIIKDGQLFMECQKTHEFKINGNDILYYDGFYNPNKIGFFGQWYFKESNALGDFYIKFLQEE